MANVIKLEREQMLAEASSFRQEGENFESSIGRMDELTRNLTEVWQGAAAQAYTEKYQQLRPNLVQCRELIEQIAVALEKVVQTMDEADANIASAFKLQ